LTSRGKNDLLAILFLYLAKAFLKAEERTPSYHSGESP